MKKQSSKPSRSRQGAAQSADTEMDFAFVVTSLLKIVGILVVILTMVSYAVYAERRVSAFIQDRLGPNRVGPAGVFQPVADMFKLLLKEDFTPRAANTFYYWLAPCLAVMPAIITIAVVPFGSTLFGVPMVIADVNVGILFVFAIASLGVYGIVLGGWASNSKYPFLGGIRSSAQMLSYELSLGLAVIPVFLVVGNLRLTSVVRYQIDQGWFIAPFVGDWTDPWKWLLAIPMVISFLGKVAVMIFVFMWVRWTLPRFRWDQLMRLGWLFFFEIALVNIFIVAGLMALLPK